MSGKGLSETVLSVPTLLDTVRQLGSRWQRAKQWLVSSDLLYVSKQRARMMRYAQRHKAFGLFQVALEALKELKTINKIVSTYGVHPLKLWIVKFLLNDSGTNALCGSVFGCACINNDHRCHPVRRKRGGCDDDCSVID